MKIQCLRDLIVEAIEATFDHSAFAEAILNEVEERIDYDEIAKSVLDNHDFDDILQAHIENEYYDLPY